MSVERQGGRRELLQDALRETARERRSTAHPDLQTLAAYSEGRLQATEQDAIQEHLGLCRRCSTIILDAARISQTEAGGGDREGFDSGALWRALHRRLEGDTGSSRRGLRSDRKYVQWVYGAVAAVMGTILVGLSMHVMDLRRKVWDQTRLQLNVPVVVLLPDAFVRSSAEAPGVLTLEPGVGMFTLVLSSSDRVPARPVLEIETSAGEPVWRGEGLERNADGSFTVSLPRAWLPPGRYRLRLVGGEERDGDGRDHRLATAGSEEYSLEVRSR